VVSAGSPGTQALAPGRTLVFESDWVAGEPFFYNLRTHATGRCINDVIDFAELEVDPQGFYDYLDFGFSIGERTPVKDVRFLRYSARLWRGADGRLSVEYLDDPMPPLLGSPSREADVLEMVREGVGAWERSVEGPIALPLSGGLDSRLLALSVGEPGRVRAFTYGTSDVQEKSEEVVKARIVADTLGLAWQRIPLGHFHRYMGEWDDIYGPYVHAHGMYQLEFYHSLLRIMDGPVAVLSGCTGDAFAGSDDETLSLEGIDSPDGETVALAIREMSRLGLYADASQSLLPCDEPAWRRLWAGRPELVDDLRLRVLESQRSYLALLSYLVTAPQALGCSVGAPYMDLDLAAAMLNLPLERRRRRRWLREYFAAAGLGLESRGVTEQVVTLNMQALRLEPLPPLDERLLGEVVRPQYVRWINRGVGRVGRLWEAYWRLGHRPGFRRTVRLLNSAGLREQRSGAYVAYLCLAPIESMLRKRDAARRGTGLPDPATATVSREARR
jgi:hypothetical protein